MFEKSFTYIDNLATQAERAFAKYIPLYIDWMTQKLAGTEPMTTLSMAVGAIFVLVVYIWFRNR